MWRSLWLYVAVAATASASSMKTISDVHVHVRVHPARVSGSVELVCPLGDGLHDAPVVLLPCPVDCRGHADVACVLFPGEWQPFCPGECLRGDSCAIQCVDEPIATQWTLWSVHANDDPVLSIPMDVTNGSTALRVDGALVRGLKVMDGVVMPPQLREVAIDGGSGGRDGGADNATSALSIPANFFDRVGAQATSISLANVALADQEFSSRSSFPTINELRIMRSALEQFPFEASEMPNVSLLDLSTNMLHSFNGSGFANLTELYLGDNQITDISAGSLPASLKVLNVSSNTLKGFPTAIRHLKSLRNLTLDNNGIGSVSSDALPASSAITALSLRNASLSGIPTSLARLKKLSVLYLDQNDLSQSNATSFTRLPKSLSQLSLNAVNLRRLPTGLKNHLNLTSLSLASNSLGNSSAIDCSALPNTLLELNLSSSQLRLTPKGLHNLSSLAVLDLSGNSFQAKIDVSQLPPSLTDLYLDNCIDEVPMLLRKLTRLKTLSLKNNPISGEFAATALHNVTALFLDGTAISSFDAFTNSTSLATISCRKCANLSSLPALPASVRTVSLSHVAMDSIAKGMLPATVRSLSLTDVSKLSALPEDVHAMTELLHLNLSSCSLTNFTSHDGLRLLEDLTLRNNSLTSFSATLPAATTLDLKNNRLQSFNLSNASVLTHLNLAHNDLERIPEDIFALQGLQSLRLEDNPIRGFQPSSNELAFLSKVSFLGMDQHQFSTDCASPFQLKHLMVCVADSVAPPNTARSDTSKSSTNKKSSSGLTIAMDILLVLGLVLAVAFIWRRDKRERSERRRNEKEAIYAARSAEMSPCLAHVDINSLAPYRLEKDAVFKSRRVGTGIYGEVWLAIYGSQRVAIKQLKHKEATPDAVQRFTQEAKLVSDLDHPNIVAFVGVVWTEVTDLALITVFAENGNLRDHLKRVEPPSSGQWDLSKAKIALDIAEALAYLHTMARPVIHRDLQSRNVLLDGQFNAQVAGFDVAVRGHSGSSQAMTGKKLIDRVGSVRWFAPELLNGSPFDASADIFSLGVILSELDTHDIPYSTVQDETGEPIGDDIVKTRVADGTLRLTLSPTCPRAIMELALRCSAFEPSDRPRAAEVVKQLEVIHRDLQTETGVSL